MLTRIRKAQEEREGGFTLIELLVVIIIIGILAAVAIPVFLSQRQKGYDAASKSELKNIATAQESFATDNVGNRYADTVANLLTVGYVKSAPYDATADMKVTITAAPANPGWCAVVRHPSNPDKWWGQSNTSGSAVVVPKGLNACAAGVLDPTA